MTSIRIKGMAVAAVLSVAAGVTVLDRGEESPTVTVMMANAGPVEIGSDVRSAGVLVGSVKDLELIDNTRVKMTLEVDEGILPVHQDATVTVRPVNLLGEDYVDLDTGSADRPFLEKNVIPESQSSVAPTLQGVLDTFQAPTAASLAAVLTTLGEGLHGNGGKTARTIKELVGAMGQAEELGGLLSAQNRELADLIQTADPVAAVVAQGGGATLERLVAKTTMILGALADQQVALRTTLERLPSTLSSARATLTHLNGVATGARPVLKDLAPITSDLDQVTDELERFSVAADPAVASLVPVLDKADELLDQAAPIVARLKNAGPDVASAAENLNPVGRELLDKNLYGVMEFVRKWALSTNGRDALGHYFRGVLYISPAQLESIAQSLIPTGINLGVPAQDGNGGKTRGGNDLTGVGDTLEQLDDTINGLTDALGLTKNQEAGLLGSLLGGK